ncbi:discoidin domain-containing protein [Proteinivorax tanatarense]|uniref:Discoidin domain-containing protein n=1 Tax=Proteinivorax tanatarense TaxID=1260629 RepID=A0AAU7VKC2_9FIRM
MKKSFLILLVFLMALNLAACSEDMAQFEMTEEANPEVAMENGPISSYWFPDELLEWDPSEDPDLLFNKSTVPLADRVSRDRLPTINNSQNKDVNVVALSIMNSSTSGNPSNGTNEFDSNTFTYWQYIDQLVYWGGSSGEGIIVPPSPDVVDAAHKNGVPVLGTVFFPPEDYGGQMKWLEQFLVKDDDGNFPMADKLIEVASVYQFDGWFINQEIAGTEDEPVTDEHAKLMQEFIKAFKDQAPHLEIMWYDAMTKEGEMGWQNALTDENAFFLIDEKEEPVADSMFLNFWWTVQQLADKELIQYSNDKADELGIDPYDLYAGVDVQADGLFTPIRWDLFEDDNGVPLTSLGLYCPSWTYYSASNVNEFHENENLFWVNNNGDPRNPHNATGKDWRGISSYVVERTVLNSVPFTTNFNMGNGYNFFIDGEQVSKMNWNNRSMMDVMPTYRWIIDNEGNNDLTASIDYADAYYGGTSIKFRGNMESDKKSTITLFSADLEIEEDYRFTATAKAMESTELNAVLTFEDGNTEVIEGDKEVENQWTEVEFDLSSYEGEVIQTIGLEVSTKEDKDPYELSLGRLSILNNTENQETEVSNLQVIDKEFDEENIYAGIRLTWDKDDNSEFYEVYRTNDNDTKSFLGVTRNPGFFINGIEREEEGLESTFKVVPVNKHGARGTSDTTEMTWPDNRLPRAGFEASQTLIAPGDSVTFNSTSTANTEELNWSFEGADIDSSTDDEPTVTFNEEGTFKVQLTAKNDEGEDIIEKDEFITVSSKVEGELENLALDKDVDASGYVNDNEAPPFAVDGTLDTKWCVTGPAPHHITVDLGKTKTISEVFVAHAEAGGESELMNTERYIVEVSDDGEDFTEVLEVTNNSDATTLSTFKAVEARYVRLVVTKPTQGSDSAARIYQFEARGIPGEL